MNLFGINGGELMILIVLAFLLLGPEKIPEYTRKLRDWVRKLRRLAENAKVQFKEETGTDFDDVDWQKYDPRQYDPRRIIREALEEPLEDLQASAKNTTSHTDERAGTVTRTDITTAAATGAGGAVAVTSVSRTTAVAAVSAGRDGTGNEAVDDPSAEDAPTPFDSEAT